MSIPRVLACVLAGVFASACAPALDWREVRAEGSGIVALFPCKPDRHARTVALAGRTLRMEMLVCSAAGASYAVAFTDLPNPAAVTPVLADLRAAAIANIGARRLGDAAAQIPGMTPNPQAVRISLRGARPDGIAVDQHAAFFARGLRVYQAIVLGPDAPQEAAQTFFDALKLQA